MKIQQYEQTKQGCHPIHVCLCWVWMLLISLAVSLQNLFSHILFIIFILSGNIHPFYPQKILSEFVSFPWLCKLIFSEYIDPTHSYSLSFWFTWKANMLRLTPGQNSSERLNCAWHNLADISLFIKHSMTCLNAFDMKLMCFLITLSLFLPLLDRSTNSQIYQPNICLGWYQAYWRWHWTISKYNNINWGLQPDIYLVCVSWLCHLDFGQKQTHFIYSIVRVTWVLTNPSAENRLTKGLYVIWKSYVSSRRVFNLIGKYK